MKRKLRSTFETIFDNEFECTDIPKNHHDELKVSKKILFHTSEAIIDALKKEGFEFRDDVASYRASRYIDILVSFSISSAQMEAVIAVDPNDDVEDCTNEGLKYKEALREVEQILLRVKASNQI